KERNDSVYFHAEGVSFFFLYSHIIVDPFALIEYDESSYISLKGNRRGEKVELVRKILPLGEPPIRGYLKFAYPLSIAVQHPDFPGWFACNYTQLTYRPDSISALDFYPYKQVNPLLGEMYLPKSMILKYA